jgi:hypothetical protein
VSGDNDYPPEGHDSTGDEPAHDGGPDHFETPLLDEDDYAPSHIDAEITDEPGDFGAHLGADHDQDGDHSFVAGSPETVPGPSWVHAVDPFAVDPAAFSDQTIAPYDADSFVAALDSDYIATWTAEPADHVPPVWDDAASARLAEMTPHPGAGVDAVLLGESAESPESMVAELWHESLPEEPLPVDPNGQPLGPGEVLDHLIARLEDPAEADVARAVREGLAP